LVKWVKEPIIINETADVVDLGNEIENPGSKFIFPFRAHKALVPGNGSRGQRKGAVVIVAQEVVEGQVRTGRNLPGEEVVVTKRECKFAEVCRRQLVVHRHINALDETDTCVASYRIDCFQTSELVAGYPKAGASGTLKSSRTVTKTIRIHHALRQQDL
jgi:hypothetical protein